MNLKTYRAASIAEALGQIKSDLGSDAVILHTRTYKHGGWLGLGGRRMVEITASTGLSVVHPLARKGKAPAAALIRPGMETLRKTYGAPAPGGVAIGGAPPGAETKRSVDASEAGSAMIAAAGSARTGGPAGGETCDPQDLAVRGAAGEVARSVVASASLPAGAAGLWDEISAIKRLVGQVLQTTRGRAQPMMPEALFQRYLRLIEAEVAAELAEEIVAGVRDELNAEELADETIVHQAVLRRLAAFIPVAAETAKAGRAGDGRPLTIALIGPTGVGKTTTIAKLAATYKLRHGRSVGLITSDTYRIAAVEQLRTYAHIIGLPLKVALTPAEMGNACQSFSDADVVLIDTAGRSQHDAGRLTDLASFLDAASPHETHLVLSGAANQACMLRAAERFALARPNRIIFTKLDEVVNFGVLVNASKAIGARLSFVTTGQEVPDHIEPGRSDRLARLVLEGGRAS